MSDLNALASEDFVATLGTVFEGSPWVAARAWQSRPFRDRAELMAALWAAVLDAESDAQDGLLRAHPDLAGAADRAPDLTVASSQEQAAAGLDACTPPQRDALARMNREHRRRFGYPLIVAVRGMSVPAILDEMRARLALDPQRARVRALVEVRRIAEGRLDRLLGGA